MQHDVSLADRYDLTKKQVLLNGTQALVRMMLMQSARDRAAGHDTAGYVTGYRGSPLGAVDFQMARASAELEKAQVRFQEGLNEDLAATALWGIRRASGQAPCHSARCGLYPSVGHASPTRRNYLRG